MLEVERTGERMNVEEQRGETRMDKNNRKRGNTR